MKKLFFVYMVSSFLITVAMDKNRDEKGRINRNMVLILPEYTGQQSNGVDVPQQVVGACQQVVNPEDKFFNTQRLNTVIEHIVAKVNNDQK